MDTKTLEKLFDHFSKHRYVTYKKGDIIYRPNDGIDHISFIKSGYVRLYTVNKNGEEATLDVFKPVFYLTLLYAMTDTQNHYYFEAVTPVELWKAPRQETLAFIRNDAEVMYSLMRSIMSGLKSTMMNLEVLISGDSYAKICGLLTSFALQYGEKTEQGIRISHQTTHKLIGSLTGLTRETVTSQLDKITKDGLISRESKHITILDFDRLKDAAGLPYA